MPPWRSRHQRCDSITDVTDFASQLHHIMQCSREGEGEEDEVEVKPGHVIRQFESTASETSPKAGSYDVCMRADCFDASPQSRIRFQVDETGDLKITVVEYVRLCVADIVGSDHDETRWEGLAQRSRRHADYPKCWQNFVASILDTACATAAGVAQVVTQASKVQLELDVFRLDWQFSCVGALALTPKQRESLNMRKTPLASTMLEVQIGRFCLDWPLSRMEALSLSQKHQGGQISRTGDHIATKN